MKKLVRCPECRRYFTSASCPFCALGAESRTAAGRAELRKAEELLSMVEGLERRWVGPNPARRTARQEAWDTRFHEVMARLDDVAR
jgi:hypothetical protein